MEQSILLVEDEAALRMSLGDRLRVQGYQVDCAPDGEIGFEKATSRAFDLMIFDIMLPRRNGVDLCRDVRQAGLGAPILLLTACNESSMKAAGLDAGADDFVTKPFDMRDLSARVEALLQRPPTSGSRSGVVGWPQVASRTPAVPLEEDRGIVTPFDASEQRRLQEAFLQEAGARLDSSDLPKIIPQLEQMLNKQRQNPLTTHDRKKLDIAESIFGFLREALDAIRVPKKRK
jgi:DNA-binding response OmpR family regulator